MKTSKKTATIIAAAIGMAISTTSANAQTPTTIVETGDLDLTQADDQIRLKERTDRAIRAMCATNSRSVRAMQMESKCRETALAQAESKIRLAVANANSQRTRLAARAPLNLDG